ncbi:MAG TPA: electron transfer flavoprotein-ubiquinone oxidoreductase [Stellaceae bacterium]|nr:electron transfer flavoprotein-ubiquinone oxidoreductase [Stellaceae bacterium]
MERESMQYDVVVVGAGPSGLSAAIRLKQLAADAGREVSVCVLEKGSEVGAHILSGAVLDPLALNELIPDWRKKGAPVDQKVTQDRFLILSETGSREIPSFLLPPLMRNHGNYIISLGALCRWLGSQAEALGVEIYPGFAAAELLFHEDGRLKGVATGDMGVGRDGEHKDGFTPGMELHATYTLIAEGARGSLAKQLIKRFDLAKDSQPQKYGLGIKELWRVDPARHKPGLVMHSQGWPLDAGTGGGSFLYHFGDCQVAAGFVVHLDYANPYLSPFEEFQRFKTHPDIRDLFEGGSREGYGARAISEGGLQSVPKLTFAGGALVGCAAGFVNLPRIKGTHNAMKTGMLAAEAAFAALSDVVGGEAAPAMLEPYETGWRRSWVFDDLHKVRNVKPGLKWGMAAGTIHGGVHMWLNQLGLGFLVPWTLAHAKADHESLMPASECEPIAYPKPDGKISFDRLSSVFLSNTAHEEDQPAHLRLTDPDIAIRVNLARYDAPEQRYCPAGVYEILDEGGEARLQINAANCVHCKTCDIKDPCQNIDWVVPEGGGGPNYGTM